jgi:hypothetical protein
MQADKQIRDRDFIMLGEFTIFPELLRQIRGGTQRENGGTSFNSPSSDLRFASVVWSVKKEADDTEVVPPSPGSKGNPLAKSA